MAERRSARTGQGEEVVDPAAVDFDVTRAEKAEAEVADMEQRLSTLASQITEAEAAGEVATLTTLYRQRSDLTGDIAIARRIVAKASIGRLSIETRMARANLPPARAAYQALVAEQAEAIEKVKQKYAPKLGEARRTLEQAENRARRAGDASNRHRNELRAKASMAAAAAEAARNPDLAVLGKAG